MLYSTANDPQPQLIPRPQMIPKMDRKWSSTASDPQSRPQMIAIIIPIIIRIRDFSMR